MKVTGVTVHFADEEFDRGPIVAQEVVRIEETDTVEDVEAKIHAVEHELYPRALGYARRRAPAHRGPQGPRPPGTLARDALITRAFGLAETCRVVGGGIPLWHYHRERLRRGGCPPGLLVEAEARALTEATKWADSASRRVRLGITITPEGELTVVSGVHLSSLDVVNGPVAVRVDLSEIATAENPVPPLPSGAAKPADRGWWDAAQRLAKRGGGHQAVLVDAAGELGGGADAVIDGGSATVWIAERGRLVTPPAPLAVGGVARAFVLDAAPKRGSDVAIEPISWARFEAADEAFLTNAFAGAVEVRGRGGERLSAVKALFELVWGRESVSGSQPTLH